MHELSLVSSMLDTVANAMPPGTCLAEVHVTLGPLCGVSPDALEFCFVELARERGFPAARLQIARTSSRAKCKSCDHSYDLSSFDAVCPECGTLDRSIESGREFTLDSIEVEEA